LQDCFDDVEWFDSAGDSCEWYENNDEPDCPIHGRYYANSETNITANDAW